MEKHCRPQQRMFVTLYVRKFADNMFRPEWVIVRQFIIFSHTKKGYCTISCLILMRSYFTINHLYWGGGY